MPLNSTFKDQKNTSQQNPITDQKNTSQQNPITDHINMLSANNEEGEENKTKNMKYIDKWFEQTIKTNPSIMRIYNKSGIPLAVFGKKKKVFRGCKKYGCDGLGSTQKNRIRHYVQKHCPNKILKPLFEKSEKLLEKSTDLEKSIANKFEHIINSQVNHMNSLLDQANIVKDNKDKTILDLQAEIVELRKASDIEKINTSEIINSLTVDNQDLADSKQLLKHELDNKTLANVSRLFFYNVVLLF
jgi:hypothetical protein